MSDCFAAGHLPFASAPTEEADCDFCGIEAPASARRRRADGWRRCGNWLACPPCAPELAAIRKLRGEAVR